MKVQIIPGNGNPPGQLATAEIRFSEGILAGLKLIGFGIWESRAGNRRTVTFPARSYQVNGERRSFALVRPISDSHASETLQHAILDEYARFEQSGSVEEVVNG